MDNEPAMPRQQSVYIPLLIGLAALVGFLGFQVVELWRAHNQLVDERDGQEAAIVEADKMRRQLTVLASKTAELAQKGDPDAKAIVDEYARRGLTFLPPRAVSGGNPPPR